MFSFNYHRCILVTYIAQIIRFLARLSKLRVVVTKVQTRFTSWVEGVYFIILLQEKLPNEKKKIQ